MTASVPRTEASGQRWLMALLLAVLWHIAVVVGLEWLDPFAAEPVAAAAPAPVQLVFNQPAPSPPPSARDDEPTRFTELPEDRADVVPDRADFLSNVDSRAADRTREDASTLLPRMNGRADSPQVAMQPSPAPSPQEAGAGDPDAQRAADVEPSPLPEADQTSEDRFQALEKESTGEDQGEADDLGETRDRTGSGEAEVAPGGAPSTVGDPREQMLRRGRNQPIQAPRFRVGLGRGDLFQEEMDNPLGNVNLFADLSLNTVAWDWAPWIQRFIRDYHRNWIPPYAYAALGITTGYQVVDVEVAPDGRLLHLEVLEQTGHESLTHSTVATFRAFAPYHPLPEGFPEPTLQMRIKVNYPAFRH